MAEYIAASEALERLMGGNPAGSPGGSNEFAGAREELAALILRRVEAIRAREAQCDAAQSNPDGGDALSSERAVAFSSSAPAPVPAAVRVSAPVELEPPPQPPWGKPTEPAAVPPLTEEERQRQVAEINRKPPPSHYLRDGQPREAWRDHLDANGEIIAPYFRPNG
jgi:hypothetical protein